MSVVFCYAIESNIYEFVPFLIWKGDKTRGRRMKGRAQAFSQYFNSNVNRVLKVGIVVSLTFMSFTSPLKAADRGAWADLQQMVFKNQFISPALNKITLTAPYRAKDDRRVPIEVNAKLSDGRTIKKLTIIIDNNPMPVSAVFEMAKQRKEVSFKTHMRMNGPSPVRVIIEANDGKLYMKQQLVKTSGLGACASPPVGDPKELLANLGDMKLKPAGLAKENVRASKLKRKARLEIKHPNLTGLQMDQITLQYILARFVNTVEVRHGSEKLFTLTASISLSQDPDLTFDYLFNGSNEISVKAIDTDDTKFEKSFPVGLDS